MSIRFKLISTFAVLLISLGAGLIWLGLRSQSDQHPPSSPVISTSIPESSPSAVFNTIGEKVFVTKVRDGDTFEIEGGLAVRMIGVDTPETVDPKKPVGCFGKEASNITKSLISGKEVYLQKDVSENDKYQRLLRYVYLPLPDGKLLFVNDYLVREGFAKVLTYPPDVKYNEQFREAEREAKEGKSGLWGRC